MSNVEQSMSREDVLATLRQTYARFDELLGHFDQGQVAQLRVHGNWTVKDILAHLASWDKLEIGWIEDVIAGRKPVLYTKGYEWDLVDRQKQIELIHRYNAQVLEECRTRPVEDVVVEFRDMQKRLLDVVTRLPDVAFNDPDMLFWIKLEVPRDPWTPLPVNSHEHYKDHANWILAWIRKERKGQTATNPRIEPD
ncbi:MAG TPA: ClbS/DfsB family four-helix bundle protein [Candidatus Hydrogenedentes bacterium]|nr:ClbS/DfsB family four-helix bundle protein [Candidatus Hydrogenedentota bacterium]